MKFICNFGCKTVAYTGSYSQVRQHLIGKLLGQRYQGIGVCPKLSQAEKELLKEEELAAQRIFGGNCKAIFINGHDVSSIEKTGANITELLLKAIDYVGPSNVVQVVTDNTSNCKATDAIIQRKHAHIFWSGSMAHTLNLLMKDIAKIFLKKKSKAIVKYIKNHSSCQYLFKTFLALELLKAKEKPSLAIILLYCNDLLK
ncbi:hypothetical protein ACSBR2_023436 [Camellia fascicularis]